MLACDNFFTSPTLLLSLVAHSSYALGTLERHAAWRGCREEVTGGKREEA